MSSFRACRAFSPAVALLTLAPLVAFAAHGTTPLKVVETLAIDASPDKVWHVLGDFQKADWLPDVSQATGEGGNVPDQAHRSLLLCGGATIDETLTKYEPKRMTLGYHMDHVDLKTLPATNYTAILTVRPGDDGKSVVEWKARFYRGYPNGNPPPELNDDVAEKAVTALHRASLAALKAKVEGKVDAKGKVDSK